MLRLATDENFNNDTGLLIRSAAGEGESVRLTEDQVRSIVQTVFRLTSGRGTVFLFGSRLDNQKRGGDVDLLIETDVPLTLIERARIKMELESACGLSVDVVSQGRNSPPTPFQKIARANAVRLEAHA